MPVDEAVKAPLDNHLLAWGDVTSRWMFGGVAYSVRGKMFAVFMDGFLGAKLPDEIRAQALAQGVASPFRPTGRPFGQWVQFPLTSEGGVSAIISWIEAAYDYVGSLQRPNKRRKAPLG